MMIKILFLLLLSVIGEDVYSFTESKSTVIWLNLDIGNQVHITVLDNKNKPIKFERQNFILESNPVQYRTELTIKDSYKLPLYIYVENRKETIVVNEITNNF